MPLSDARGTHRQNLANSTLGTEALRLGLNTAFAKGEWRTIARYLHGNPADSAAVLALLHLLDRPKPRAARAEREYKLLALMVEARIAQGRREGRKLRGLQNTAIWDVIKINEQKGRVHERKVRKALERYGEDARAILKTLQRTRCSK